MVGRYSWSEKRSPYHTTYFRPVPFFSVPNSRRVVAVFPSFLVFRLFHRDFSIHLLALVYRWSSRAFPPLSPFPPPLCDLSHPLTWQGWNSPMKWDTTKNKTGGVRKICLFCGFIPLLAVGESGCCLVVEAR